MFLSDTDILAELADGALSIDPLADIDLQVQPASVDLRLAPEFLRFDQPQIEVVDPEADADMRRYTTKQTISDTDSLVIHPGDFILASTVETVNIPPDLIGFVKGRSSIGRLGVIIHTAGLIDPGYTGQITLEITNIGSAPVALTNGLRIAQLTLMQLQSPADRPYGTDRGSKYQDQSGPTASQIDKDPEIGE